MVYGAASPRGAVLMMATNKVTYDKITIYGQQQQQRWKFTTSIYTSPNAHVLDGTTGKNGKLYKKNNYVISLRKNKFTWPINHSVCVCGWEGGGGGGGKM